MPRIPWTGHTRTLVPGRRTHAATGACAHYQEMVRLRRDLHDGLGPGLAGIMIRADILAQPAVRGPDRRRGRCCASCGTRRPSSWPSSAGSSPNRNPAELEGRGLAKRCALSRADDRPPAASHRDRRRLRGNPRRPGHAGRRVLDRQGSADQRGQARAAPPAAHPRPGGRRPASVRCGRRGRRRRHGGRRRPDVDARPGPPSSAAGARSTDTGAGVAVTAHLPAGGRPR